MHKHTLLLFTLAALLPGCNGKENDASLSARTISTKDTPKATEVQAPVQVTIKPVQLSETKSQSIPTTPDLATLATGEKVYRSTCSICHKSGLNGAPQIGSKKDWEPRIAQGKEVLYDRAINGYRGSKGSMPSRGSNPRLSEAEVKAAVDYMMEHAIPSWSAE